jgi:1,4-dihydroxy-2-naphthoate octaprenyltransferase
VTQSGLIAPGKVKSAMMLTFIIAVLFGTYLITVAGWPVIAIGIAAVLAALAYSGGPFPLASHGLGDLFVFIFFGLVAVCGTYYVQCLTVTRMAFLAAVGVGLFITAILVVNNLRDIQSDQKTGKHTLAVLLGERGSKWEFILLLTGAYLLPLFIGVVAWESSWILLPLASSPWAVVLARQLWNADVGSKLNRTLARSARLSLIYCILFAVGLVLSS